MKIALMTFARRGGMLHFLIEVANALSEELEIIVVSAKWANTGNLNKKIPHYYLDTGKTSLGTLLKLLDFRNYIKLISLLRREKVDIVHFTGLHEWNPVLGLVLKLFYKKPIVYTVHDPKHVSGTPIHILLQDLLFRKLANSFIVLSKKGEKELLGTGISLTKVKAMPLGLILDFSKWKNNKIQERNQILFWGRIEKYKGLDILLNASQEIFDALPNWELLIAGSGDLSPYTNMINHKNIKIVNRFLEEKEISEFIQASKILVFPYRESNKSGILLCSTAFPKGVVATDTGGLNEVLNNGENALLVEKENPKALAAAIIQMANDDNLRINLGKKFNALNNEERSWKNIRKQYLMFYQNILKS